MFLIVSPVDFPQVPLVALLLFSHLAAHLVLMVAEPGANLMHLPLVALVLGMHGAAMLCFPMTIFPMVVPMVVPVIIPVVIPMIVTMIVPVVVPMVIPMIVPMVVPVVVPMIISVIVSLVVSTVFPLLVLLVPALLILRRFHRRRSERCIRNRDPRNIQCHPTAESQCQDLFARHDDPPLSSLIASYSRKI